MDNSNEFFVDITGAVADAGNIGKVFAQKQIPEGGEVELRILPGRKSLNGLYYLKLITVWFGKKPYISPRTFGEPCLILDTRDKVLKSDNEALKYKFSDDAGFNVSETYEMYCLVVDSKIEQGQVISTKVQDDEVKRFSCTWSVINKLNQKLSHRSMLNGLPLGALDRERGRNFVISKEKVNSQTRYDVTPMPNEFPIAKRYFDNIPDLVNELKSKIYTEAYRKAALKSYLTGSPFPDDNLKYPKDNSQQAAADSANVSALIDAQAEAPAASPEPQVEEKMVEAVEPAPKVEAPAATVETQSEEGSSILDQLN